MSEFAISGLVALASLLISFLVTRFLLLYLRKKGVLDVPNERSSHKVPTPRGGGIGIMLAIILTAAFYSIYTAHYDLLPLLGISLLMGLLGWADDVKGGLSPGLRFGIQVLSAVAIFVIYQPIAYFPFPEPLNFHLPYIVGALLTVIWLVGITNIFNFLDGIDGYAGTQALLAGGALSLMLWGSPLGMVGLIIAMASLGFLFLNWHPAKIFMGDVGSSFLGFLFAALPFYMESMNKQAIGTGARTEVFFAIGIFLLFFLADGAITMIRRVLKGEKIWVAHRSHLYQRLVISGLSHSRVVLLAGFLYLILFAVFFHFFFREEQVMAWEVVIAGLLLFAAYWLYTAMRERTKK